MYNIAHAEYLWQKDPPPLRFLLLEKIDSPNYSLEKFYHFPLVLNFRVSARVGETF